MKLKNFILLGVFLLGLLVCGNSSVVLAKEDGTEECDAVLKEKQEREVIEKVRSSLRKAFEDSMKMSDEESLGRFDNDEFMRDLEKKENSPLM